MSRASLKYFYYNRASVDIQSKYAGDWSRSKGHSDDEVIIHSSVTSDERPEGTVVSAPKGWYDAGDYNKYIVNSGITTYTLLALYERFWKKYDNVNLNIPGNNSLPDILDEIKWNLDWMLKMQDPNDGGVYFKLTSRRSPNFMPSADDTKRYMVGKSTSSALNFAAVMATAYRIYKPFDDQLSGYADTCLHRAYRAFVWAKENNNNRYFNPSDIDTRYGDSYFGDEFTWAASNCIFLRKMIGFMTI